MGNRASAIGTEEGKNKRKKEGKCCGASFFGTASGNFSRLHKKKNVCLCVNKAVTVGRLNCTPAELSHGNVIREALLPLSIHHTAWKNNSNKNS